MTKSNIHKKITFEDKFDRKFACWVENNPKAWRFWKRKTRKDFRRKMKKALDSECCQCYTYYRKRGNNNDTVGEKRT